MKKMDAMKKEIKAKAQDLTMMNNNFLTGKDQSWIIDRLETALINGGYNEMKKVYLHIKYQEAY